MKHRIKYISLILIISLVVSGCSIKYDFNIKNDNTVKETIKVSFITDDCYMSDDDEYSSCKEFINDYKTLLSNKYKLVDYDTKVKEENENTTVTFSHTYDSIEEFINSNTYQLFFLKNESSINSFNYSGFKVVQDYMEENGLNDEEIDSFSIKLTTNKKVTDCNASRSFQNTHMWNMSDLSNDSIKFTLGKTEKQKTDKVIDDKNLKNKDTSNEKKNNDYLVIAGFIFGILILLVISLIILLRLRKNSGV